MASPVTPNGAAQTLQERLNDPRTADALVRLLDRVDTIEGLLAQGPGMAAMVADSVDEFVAGSGTDLEIVLQHALQVADRLQNPRLVNAITRLLEQPEALELLASAAEQGPGMLATLADTLDEMAMNAHQAGLDVEALLQNSLTIAARLQNPRMAAALDKLLSQVEAVELLASAAEQGPGMAAMVADSVDDFVRTSDIDFDLLLDKGLGALLRTINLVESPQFDALLNSGVLDPAAIEVVGKVGKALADSSTQEIQPMGPMAMLKALNDPDVQRGLGFLVSVGRNFGQELVTLKR